MTICELCDNFASGIKYKGHYLCEECKKNAIEGNKEEKYNEDLEWIADGDY